MIQYDNDNPTNEEEILQESMIAEVLVKTKEIIDGKFADLKDKKEVIYVNNKSQLIKITEVERNGKDTELHQILSFDVNKLPQAELHKYGQDDDNDGSSTPKFHAPLPRVKVPVKDGMSQSKFIQQSRAFQGLVPNANETFYTAEEVAQHTTDEDCWTIFNGRVYDITQYAKVHPGGRKIFLGKGKDCTELFNKYHPWVNTQFLIGKYQVGILKR